MFYGFIKKMTVIGLLLFNHSHLFCKNVAMGTIEGTVVTFVRNETAVIPNIEVIFKSDENEWKTTSKSDGEFSIELPEGIYEITTRDTLWYPVKRGKIRIEPNKTIRLTLIPPNKGGSLLPPDYNLFSLSNNESNPDLVIQYYEKKINQKTNKYKFAILTSNETTIYAKQINFNKSDYSFEAIGVIFVEHNAKRNQAKKVTGRFERERLTLKF